MGSFFAAYPFCNVSSGQPRGATLLAAAAALFFRPLRDAPNLPRDGFGRQGRRDPAVHVRRQSEGGAGVWLLRVVSHRSGGFGTVQ